jgi:hypothetical protein
MPYVTHILPQIAAFCDKDSADPSRTLAFEDWRRNKKQPRFGRGCFKALAVLFLRSLLFLFCHGSHSFACAKIDPHLRTTDAKMRFLFQYCTECAEKIFLRANVWITFLCRVRKDIPKSILFISDRFSGISRIGSQSRRSDLRKIKAKSAFNCVFCMNGKRRKAEDGCELQSESLL